MLKVYKECCKNCLLSNNRMVSPQRAKQIVNDCIKTQTHFICHKATIKGEEVVCNSFYNKLGQFSQMIRISERLNMVKFVDLPDSEKLPTFLELKDKSK